MIRRCERCRKREWWYRGVCATCYAALKAFGGWEAWVDQRDGVLAADSPEFDQELGEWMGPA